MIILRQKSFSSKDQKGSEEQKEFNSKAAKALNNKFLRQYAIDNEISRKMLVCKEPLNPQTIKKSARLDNKYREEGHLLVNKHINDKSRWAGGAADVEGRGMRKPTNKNNHYDHGEPLRIITPGNPAHIVANNPWSGEIGQTRGELKRLRTATKKKSKL